MCPKPHFVVIPWPVTSHMIPMVDRARAASSVDHIPWTMVKHSIYLEKLFIIEGDKLGQEGYIRYKSIVGALQYVTLTMTRMDISFPVKMVY